ncbi:MAG: hypothetical protein AB7O38_09355 [Pirellulaceae bacterium]
MVRSPPPGERERYATNMRLLLSTFLLANSVGCGNVNPDDVVQPAKPVQMETELQRECREYLKAGPPEQMESYVPESLTEILIAHGAKATPIDSELAEIGGIILMESSSFSEIKDPEIRKYMQRGADLVRRVLESQK